MVIRVPAPERDRPATTLALTWLALGFRLEFASAHVWQPAEWIGTIITWPNDRVKVWVSSVSPLKEHRSFAGKAKHVAIQVDMWRPFLDDVRAALHSEETGNAPPNRGWRLQDDHSLRFLWAFLKDRRSAEFAGRIVLRRVPPIFAPAGSASVDKLEGSLGSWQGLALAIEELEWGRFRQLVEGTS